VLETPLTVEGFAMVEVAGQRRWHAQTEARRSDGDVVGFGHGRRCGRDGRARRGEGGGVFGLWPVGMAFNPHERIRTVPPTAANQGAARATLPLIVGPHTPAFF
jgi:hypothetical protein